LARNTKYEKRDLLSTANITGGRRDGGCGFWGGIRKEYEKRAMFARQKEKELAQERSALRKEEVWDRKGVRSREKGQTTQKGRV